VHLEHAEQLVIDALLAALATHAARPLPKQIVGVAHRWLYAHVKSKTEGSLWNPTLRIGAVGDWLLAPCIESAWLSGRMLADKVLSSRL
jgi:renalase